MTKANLVGELEPPSFALVEPGQMHSFTTMSQSSTLVSMLLQQKLCHSPVR